MIGRLSGIELLPDIDNNNYEGLINAIVRNPDKEQSYCVAIKDIKEFATNNEIHLN